PAPPPVGRGDGPERPAPQGRPRGPYACLQPRRIAAGRRQPGRPRAAVGRQAEAVNRPLLPAPPYDEQGEAGRCARPKPGGRIGPCGPFFSFSLPGFSFFFPLPPANVFFVPGVSCRCEP